MNYISTRGNAPALDLEAATLAGLARDGGLYVPDRWPLLSQTEIASLAGQSYARAAQVVMTPLLAGAIPPAELEEILTNAYQRFHHPATAPLVQLGPNLFLLELFHGPTLAFKDFAMQILAPIMDRALARRGRRATILAATSGDTGGAAIEAFRGREAIDIFVLHPAGRVSEAQRRQMTTATEENVHNIAIEGSFDDCQAIVKALFNDLAFRDRVALSAVNSINWARIMAQTVYYFTAATALGAPHRPVRFTVPTGNFGDIFAGYVARQMGLPVERLVIATNINDILVRAFETGRYAPATVVPSLSPSMDIQISSNFERLLFEIGGRDPDRVRALMTALADEGAFSLNAQELAALRGLFSAHRIDEEETVATIAQVYREAGYLADPHSAVGIAAAWHEEAAARGKEESDAPMIVLATAHPAKFPQAISRAIGRAPEPPEALARLMHLPERYETLANDAGAVARYIEGHARMVRAVGA